MGFLKAFLGSFNLKEFVGSKKAKMTLITIIGVIAGWLAIDIPEDLKAEAAGAVVVVIGVVVSFYLHAQGKADAGEKAARIAKDPPEA